MGAMLDIIRIRMDANDYMRLQELSEHFGTDVSTVVRASVKKTLSEAFDSDGFLRDGKAETDHSGEP